MTIFEITVPGTWLVLDDEQKSSQCQMLIFALIDAFFNANLALNLFLESQATDAYATRKIDLAQWKADIARKRELEDKIKRTDPNAQNYPHEKMLLLTDIAFKREKWQQGVIPTEIESKRSFMFANCFLTALDSFEKLLRTITQETGASKLSQFHKALTEAFPHLRGLRNTSQHMEDRIRGLGAPKRGAAPERIVPKPMDNGLIKSVNGSLMFNILNGNKLGHTKEDGHFGELEISVVSMTVLQGILQSTLNHLVWVGPERHLPSI